MDEITIERGALNPPALDAALRAALGPLVAGMSAARGEVRVHFTRPPTDTEADRARQIVALHDATAPSAEQRAELERALADIERKKAVADEAAKRNGH